MTRYKDLPEGQNLLLGSDFAKVDRSFHRLGRAFGVPIGRPVLTDAFSS